MLSHSGVAAVSILACLLFAAPAPGFGAFDASDSVCEVDQEDTSLIQVSGVHHKAKAKAKLSMAAQGAKRHWEASSVFWPNARYAWQFFRKLAALQFFRTSGTEDKAHKLKIAQDE